MKIYFIIYIIIIKLLNIDKRKLYSKQKTFNDNYKNNKINEN